MNRRNLLSAVAAFAAAGANTAANASTLAWTDNDPPPYASPLSRAAIMVENLERSEAFYREVLGLTEVFFSGVIEGEPFKSDINRLLGMPLTADVRAVMLRGPNTPSVGMIALFEVKNPSPPKRPAPGPSISLGEVCLVLNHPDLDSVIDRLKARDAIIVQEPVSMLMGASPQRETTFRDPDGTLINLIELTDARYAEIYPNGMFGAGGPALGVNEPDG